MSQVHLSVLCDHDDVLKWEHFPRYWPFVRGICRSSVVPRTKASNTELWLFLRCTPEQTAEQTVEMPVIWDAMVLIMTSLCYIHAMTKCVLKDIHVDNPPVSWYWRLPLSEQYRSVKTVIFGGQKSMRLLHYGEVKWPSWCLELPANGVFVPVYSDWQQRNKYQMSVLLSLCVGNQGIHRWPVISPHKWDSNVGNVSIWWRHNGIRKRQAHTG